MKYHRSIQVISALPLLAGVVAAVAAVATVGAGDAGAAPHGAAGRPAAPSSLSRATFKDGARRVEVERLGPAALDPSGRALAPVRLRYPGGRVVDAHVDRTAIVEIEPGSEQALADAGVALVRPLMPSIGLWLVTDTGGGDGLELAQRLGAVDPARPTRGLREAIPNLYLRLKPSGQPFTPNDPRLPGQWFFDDLAMTEAWGLSRGDPTTSITVIDTGCDLDHPDLASKIDPGRDVVDNDDDPTYEPGADGAAHGTACAGLAAAATDNGVGIAGGCPDCRLRCVRLINDAPQPLSASIDAFQFALEVNAAVVSNSWNRVDPGPVPAALADAVNNVFDHGRGGKGALVLFAAGNDDREIADDELQAVRGVLTIGAINHLEEPTSFTNRGNALDLVAPTGTLSTDIAGTEGEDPGDYTALFGGTSSACPVAAGIAGLLVSAAPDRTAAELYDVLIQTARPALDATPDANGHDLVFGYGIIDPVAALKAALKTDTPPEPTTSTSTTGGGAAGEPGDESASSGCACAVSDRDAHDGSPRGAYAAVVVGAVALVRASRRRRRPSA